MRALAKNFAAPGLELCTVPVPEYGPNDALIKIKKTAICGTDLHIYNWDQWAQKTIPVPMVVGHEFMGSIVALGDQVKGLQVGERVSGEGHLTCGYCRNCRAGKRHLCRNTVGVGVNRPGCFAEYLAIPASNVFVLDHAVADEVGAIFDPFGNAVHTALSYDLVGEDVLITGAGPIGYMAAVIAHHVGARHVVVSDINEYRLDLLRRRQGIVVTNPQRQSLQEVMKELGMKEGFDVGLEVSGAASAFASMIGVMNHGGKVALLGILETSTAIDWNQVIFKGLSLKGIYGREMFETWYKMASLLQEGIDISGVITHRLPASQFAEAFQIVGEGKAGKVVLDW
jgi:threonine 3-dehydrogenase